MRWNRCDACGKFISMKDFDRGALRHLVTPDSELTRETWETLCIKHAEETKDARTSRTQASEGNA